MSRDRKRVFKSASIVEYKSLEGYFEEMALKGWLIEKMGFGMTFRKIEPQALTFNVAMLTPKTMLDWPDQEKSTTYDEFCKSAGWQLAAENQIYRIYYHSSEMDASPIYTDDEDIYKTVKKAFLKSEFILMFLPFLYLAMALLNANSIRYDLFTSNLKVFNLFSPYVITIIIWMATIPSLYWIIINGKRLHNGDTLFYYSPKWVKNKYRLQSVLLVGMDKKSVRQEADDFRSSVQEAFSKRKIQQYVFELMADQSRISAKDFPLKEDKDYVMSVLSVLDSDDKESKYDVRFKEGEFVYKHYRIPDFDMNKKRGNYDR